MQVIDMLELFFPGRVGSSTGDANGMTHRTFPLFHAIASAGAITMMGLLVLVPSSPSHSDTGTVEITMENWAPYYQPSSAVIVPGTPVRWTNPTASPHTIRHDGCLSDGPCAFDSGPVFPDNSFSLPPLAPGLYPYHCELHPVMRGMLIVDAPQTRQIAPVGGER